MKTWKKVVIGIGIAIMVIGFGTYRFFKNNYNNFVSLDEKVKMSWAQVQNQYQRRSDLVPNLVETVKGYAAHERETLEEVTQARSRMGGVVNVTGDVVNNPQMMQKFQQMQEGLGAALQRLMVVAEKYPELKANQNFLELQAQLEGTENRISVERMRYNEAVMEYNKTIRQFPANLLSGMFKFQRAVPFEAAASAQEAPKVKF
jgi:LemA protein